jgi:hypothetical protein
MEWLQQGSPYTWDDYDFAEHVIALEPAPSYATPYGWPAPTHYFQTGSDGLWAKVTDSPPFYLNQDSTGSKFAAYVFRDGVLAPSIYGRTVFRNDGSTSCSNYCAGANGRPWNDELPLTWNGATCVGTQSSTSCDAATRGKALKCQCQANFKGWAPGMRFGNTVTTVFGNDGSTSCSNYCAGANGGSWNNELPSSWNGATCVGTQSSTSCNAATPGKALKCQCQANFGSNQYKGWAPGMRFGNT